MLGREERREECPLPPRAPLPRVIEDDWEQVGDFKVVLFPVFILTHETCNMCSTWWTTFTSAETNTFIHAEIGIMAAGEHIQST